MPPRKLGEIEGKIAVEKVRYQMNCGHIVLRSKEESIVTLSDGSFGKIAKPSIELEGMKLGDSDVFTTRFYDPSVKEDAEMIAFVDAWISERPAWCSHAEIGLKRLEEYQAVRPFSKFDSITDMDALRTMLVNGDYDIDSAMKYELQKPKEEQRKEVILILESIPGLRETKQLETSQEALVL